MRYLNPEQIDHFIEHGYIKLERAFPPEEAQRLVDRAWVRLGYDPDDPSKWDQPRIHMPGAERMDAADFAPGVWEAACDLLGGAERIARPFQWSDGFVVNLGIGADEPWQPASPESGGWHKDGDFFVHFLDSPEQGLLTIVLWSDVVPQGGPTFIATDSVPVVARHLAEHPEGVEPGGFPFKELIRECSRFEEATGNVGDVYLMHPYILHAASQNVLRRPRFITNPPVHLKEPMCFDRPHADDHSPVERAVLRGLGVERYDFRPTGERRRIVPERVRRQREMQQREQARLAP